MREFKGRQVYGVSEIVGTLSRELEQAFPDIWVEGEVTSLKRAASGHIYFALKDDSSALKTVLFRAYASRLQFQPEAGQILLVRGKISVYTASGDLQLYATFAEPAGLGAMQMAFEQLKKRLMAEGLTEPARKRQIPPFPGRVGLVTSTEGAAIRDILSVLRRRRAGFDLVVSPSLVQGAEAPASLLSALRRLYRARGIEVIVLARGGGSMEDLWAFNDERLARDIAASPIPVISAVGHEVDTVLTDLTADMRAATPSVAAELLTARRDELLMRSSEAARRALHIIRSRLLVTSETLRRASPAALGNLLAMSVERLMERCDRDAERLNSLMADRVERLSRSLADCSRTLSPTGLARLLADSGQKVDAASSSLLSIIRRLLAERATNLGGLSRLLQSLGPKSVIARGYAAVFDEGGRIVMSPGQVPAGSPISIALKGGEISARVEAGSGSKVHPALKADDA